VLVMVAVLAWVGRSRSPETVTRFIMVAWWCPSLAACGKPAFVGRAGMWDLDLSCLWWGVEREGKLSAELDLCQMPMHATECRPAISRVGSFECGLAWGNKNRG
jgi:hypothetical protein